jgi:hypothetical protein
MSLPGMWRAASTSKVTSQGETVEEALENLRDALEPYFEDASARSYRTAAHEIGHLLLPPRPYGDHRQAGQRELPCDGVDARGTVPACGTAQSQ